MKLVKTAVAGIVSMVVAGTAFAAEITGAGASFPAPVYSKWADAYQKATGNKVNYQSIGSSGGIKQINAKTDTAQIFDPDYLRCIKSFSLKHSAVR